MNTAAQIELVGVYLVPEAEQSAYLVELWVRNCKGELDFTQFSQVPRKGGLEQVAYLEHALSASGSSGSPLPMQPQDFEGDVRIAFFMHFLDTTQPLNTPIGSVSLPNAITRPERLAFLEYIEP
jgi:hypothetical protein